MIPRPVLLALLCLSTVPASAQSPMSHMHGGAVPSGASDVGYAAAMAKMHQDMAIPLSGNADRDFAAGMVPHHQGAIDMARVELEHGTDPEMRRLAQDVIDSQAKEITFMKAWLARQK